MGGITGDGTGGGRKGGMQEYMIGEGWKEFLKKGWGWGEIY